MRFYTECFNSYHCDKSKTKEKTRLEVKYNVLGEYRNKNNPLQKTFFFSCGVVVLQYNRIILLNFIQLV